MNDADAQIVVDWQVAYSGDHALPAISDLTRWASTVLAVCTVADACEVTLRVVDNAESQQLNRDYRHKDKPTNVLSFPFAAPPIDIPGPRLLGDLVIAADVVAQEAGEQQKTFEAHFCHMLVHGLLHLLGFDHISDDDTRQMENLEIAILGKFGFDNPYEMPTP